VKTHMLIAITAFLLMQSLNAGQVNIAGKWKWEDASGGQSIVLDLKPSGATLSGTITMAQASLKTEPGAKSDYYLDTDSALNNIRALFFPPVTFHISDGRISGNTISFTQISRDSAPSAGFVQRAVAGGTERLLYTGQIDGDKIRFTREYRTAPGSPLVVGTHSVSFTVERMR
jgi:hypothetical protein